MSSDRTFGVSVRWRWRSASRSEGKPAVGTASGERESIVLRTLTEKIKCFQACFITFPFVQRHEVKGCDRSSLDVRLLLWIDELHPIIFSANHRMAAPAIFLYLNCRILGIRDIEQNNLSLLVFYSACDTLAIYTFYSPWNQSNFLQVLESKKKLAKK